MDEPGISFGEFDDCLKSLETINILTFAYRPTLAFLQRVWKGGQPVNILDAGCGGGDMLRRIERLARRCDVPVHLTGIDLNPWSQKSATRSSVGSAIHFVTGDIFSLKPEMPPDIICCSLFTHHLDDRQLVEFLRWLDGHAARGWFINDLHRHFLPYYFIKIATFLFSRNRLIRHDAAVSVARAFSFSDWRRLLIASDLQHKAKLRWHFPFRLCVSCLKT